MQFRTDFLKVVVLSDLNPKVGSDNILLGYMMRKDGFGVLNNKGERFVGICNFQHDIIGDTLFKRRACYKISCVSTDRPRTSYQIYHIALNSTFRSCLLKMCNKRSADNGIEKDHHLRTSTPQLTTNRLRDPVVARQWKNFFTAQTTESLNNPPRNIAEHWVAIKSAFVSGASEVVTHVPKGGTRLD